MNSAGGGDFNNFRQELVKALEADDLKMALKQCQRPECQHCQDIRRELKRRRGERQ